MGDRRKSLSVVGIKNKQIIDKQTIFINESLSSLNKLLIDMANGSCEKFMFRSNDLLKVLQRAFKKDAHMLFVLTVSASYPDESIKTLQNGHEICKINFNILPDTKRVNKSNLF